MKSTKKRSEIQERRVAERFGGQVTPGSGNGWVKKNDVRTPHLSFELKTTSKASYTLKQSELLQAEKHALIDGRLSVFGIEMGGRTWWVLSDEDFAVLTMAYLSSMED